MYNYEIDIKASKKKQRLVIRETWFEKVIDIQLIAIFCLTLATIPTLLIYHAHVNNTSSNDYHFAYFVALIAYPLLIYLLYKLPRLLSFRKLPGISPSVNRRIVKEFAKSQELTIKNDNNDYFIGTSKITPFTWGSQITILYDGDTILFNSISFGLFGIKSPFSFGNNAMFLHHLKTLIKEKQG